jgi:hypothetical protein
LDLSSNFEHEYSVDHCRDAKDSDMAGYPAYLKAGFLTQHLNVDKKMKKLL